MKKILMILMALMLVGSLLVACSNGAGGTGDFDDNYDDETPAVEETTSGTPADGDGTGGSGTENGNGSNNSESGNNGNGGNGAANNNSSTVNAASLLRSTTWTGLTADESNNKSNLDSKMSRMFFTTEAKDASLYSFNIELYDNKTYTARDWGEHTPLTGAPDSNVYDAADRQSIRSLIISGNSGNYSTLVKIETNNNVAWFYEVKYLSSTGYYLYRIYKVTFTEANSSQR